MTWSPAVDFNPEVAAQLLAQMPPLRLRQPEDTDWTSTSQVQTYLNYYGLDFAHRFNAVHGMARLDWRAYRIAVNYWLPPNPRGTLLVVHGYYDHTGIFARVVEFGLQQQLAVLAFDLPGHGLSSGERSAIDSFDSYADLLAELLALALPKLPQPFFALGQSTGGAILLNHHWRYPQQSVQLAKIALCAPLILPRGWGLGRLAYPLLRPFVHHVKRGRSQSSHDAEFVQFLETRDPLQDQTLPLSWVGAMKAWNDYFCQLPSSQRELLVLQGTADKTVNWRYNLAWIARKLPSAQIHYIQGAGHQLVNERDDYRQQVFARVADEFAQLL